MRFKATRMAYWSSRFAKYRSAILAKMSNNKMCKENMPKTLVEGTNNFFINFSAALEYYVYKPYACK